ncbi:MAG TPA: hemolysin III family protein [Rudaea sp.]|nr:hemolysin III family protein [Rudaea sp.]
MDVQSAALRYTPGEELANSLTHGVGLLLAIAGLCGLMFAAGGLRETATCLVYGVTLILVYATSTLYHGVREPDAKQRLRTLDHIAIFLLIAGTYTPFMLLALRGAWGWSLFGIVWTLAVLGTIFELTSLRRHRRAMIALYVGMGWVGLIAIKPLVAALPVPALWLLFGGGVSYTAGVVFYRWHGLRYHHAIWHLFVLGGSVMQYFAVLFYVLPKA